MSAQVAINIDGSAPAASAMLDVQDTARGMLLPRLTTAERDAIANPADGLVIYNTDLKSLNYFNGTIWKKLDFGVSIENLFNVEWNETQFATESRLFDEHESVEEIHFTPGTPFFIKGSIQYLF